MPIPDYQSVMLPLLVFAGDQKDHSVRDATDHISKEFRLSEEERKALLPSGRQYIVDNRVGWAKTYLKKAGLLESPRRSMIRITEAGLEVLKKNPKEINVKFLDQFPGFVEFRKVGKGDQEEEPKERVASEQTPQEALTILRQAKNLAQEYRTLTGKPLGITGEVAEYEAARLLGVELTPARQAGYDAVGRSAGTTRHLQVKGRCMLPGSKPGQRLGSIDIMKEWDAVLMVLLDENFDALEIYEAERPDILRALSAPGSKARIERGALGVRKFKAIGRLRWRRDSGT